MPAGNARRHLYSHHVIFRGFLTFLLSATACLTTYAQKPVPVPPPPPPVGGALEALSLIPRDAAKRVARIEAREGRPKPDRWYVLVHEPEAPRGVREFVVADSKIAAARHISQFVDKLTEPEIFGEGFVRADSDYCARIAELYATENGSRPGYIHYQLARPTLPASPQPPPPEATWPVWRLTVLDPSGDQIGVLQISAARGTVLSHDGFEKSPDSFAMPTPPTPPPASVTNPPKPKDPNAPKPTPKPKKPSRKKEPV